MARFSAEEEFSWISISDIMSGLMMVFLFVAVLYMINVEHKQSELDKILQETGMSADSLVHFIPKLKRTNLLLQNKQDSISRIIAQYRDNKSAIYRRIKNQMGADLQRWGAEVDPQTLTIRFNGTQTKFDPGVDELSSGFKTVLDEFIPKFLQIVTDDRFTPDILEVRIEGHAVDTDQGFETIFKGSQNRARNVLHYVRSSSAYQNLSPAKRQSLNFKMTATGMGFNRMIDAQGRFVHKSGTSTCSECSRRVEFSILTASEQVVYQIEKKL
jgi:outer membrane protein OmpA-like peptidoglycan-associated protein